MVILSFLQKRIFPCDRGRRHHYQLRTEILINWTNIDTVFLDMDGTLLDLYFDSFFWHHHLPQRYADHHGITEPAARDHVIPRLQAKEGMLDWYCLEYWSQDLNLDILGLKHEVKHLINWRPTAREFLSSLQTLDKRIILATNADQHSLSLKLGETDLGEFVHKIISSHDLGFAKEKPGFWEAVNTIEPFDPDRSLFIDDNLSVLRQAEEFGIRYLLSIDQPDSSQPPRGIDEFMTLGDFSDLIETAQQHKNELKR